MEKWMCKCTIAVKMMTCIYIRSSSDVCIPLDTIPLSKSVYCISYIDISYIIFQFVLMPYLVLYLEGTLAISRASFMIQCRHYIHASFFKRDVVLCVPCMCARPKTTSRICSVLNICWFLSYLYCCRCARPRTMCRGHQSTRHWRPWRAPTLLRWTIVHIYLYSTWSIFVMFCTRVTWIYTNIYVHACKREHNTFQLHMSVLHYVCLYAHTYKTHTAYLYFSGYHVYMFTYIYVRW